MITGTLLAFFRPEAPAKASHPAGAGLTFAERVAYQRAIEEVYWRHRIWPKEQSESQAIARCRDVAGADGKESPRLSAQVTGAGGLLATGQSLLSNCRLKWIAWPAHQTARGVARTL